MIDAEEVIELALYRTAYCQFPCSKQNRVLVAFILLFRASDWGDLWATRSRVRLARRAAARRWRPLRLSFSAQWLRSRGLFSKKARRSAISWVASWPGWAMTPAEARAPARTVLKRIFAEWEEHWDMDMEQNMR